MYLIIVNCPFSVFTHFVSKLVKLKYDTDNCLKPWRWEGMECVFKQLMPVSSVGKIVVVVKSR